MDFGTALTVVPGGKAGFPGVPILAVTSCVSAASKLFFVDTSTNPATFKTSVTTSPKVRWDALTYRPDKGDLLGCNGGDGTSLYVIHFSPFDPVATGGSATFLVSGPSGSTCGGIAWDPKDKTVYQASTNVVTNADGTGTSFAVLHYAPANRAAATSIPSGCAGPVAGVGVAGVSLFVACEAVVPLEGPITPASIRQLDKANGNVVRALTGESIPAVASGVPDDPGTFASQQKDALWTKNASSSSSVLVAFEVPGGLLGQSAGAPLLFPAACDQVTGSAPDTDGDGLLDCWENGSNWADGLPGISLDGTYTAGRDAAFRAVTLCVDFNGNGVFDPGECASPTHKDIFVEIDYMQFHRPDAVAMTNVVNAFANAPNTNPDGTTGIRLHLQIDEQLTHVANTALVPCTPLPGLGDADFDVLKAASFGTAAERADIRKLNAKRNGFHWALVAHNLTGSTASGCAELLGNDLMVSLGSFTAATVAGHTGGVGTTDQQGATLMHELGHNLNLRHGGGDNLNCKPHYPSIMSYSRQFSTPLNPRPLDYSRVLLGVAINTPPGVGIDENSLNEQAAIGSFSGSIVIGPPQSVPFQGIKPVVVPVNGGATVDWNGNKTINTGTFARDVNNTGIAGCPTSPGEVLPGYDDWSNIQLNFRGGMDFADGAHASVDASKAADAANSNNAAPGSLEMTLEEAVKIGYDLDRDGVPDILDNCPLTPNPSQNPDACQIGLRIVPHIVPAKPHRVVLVAMLSTTTLDATMIDRTTAVITGSAAQGSGIWSAHVTPSCKIVDVNRDGRKDLVCAVKLDSTQLPLGISNVVLDATMLGGATVRGHTTLEVRAGTGGQGSDDDGDSDDDRNSDDD
jgi:hypothetical protein